MITFIVGLLLGLTLGWLRLRVLAKALRAATAERKTMSEALMQSSELLKKLASTIENQHTVSQINKGFDSTNFN